jgi:hypothetical protein
MFRVDVPAGADGRPLVPSDEWVAWPAAARAVVVALAVANAWLEARVRDLEARLGQDSSNSSHLLSHRAAAIEPPVRLLDARQALGALRGHLAALAAVGPSG